MAAAAAAGGPCSPLIQNPTAACGLGSSVGLGRVMRCSITKGSLPPSPLSFAFHSSPLWLATMCIRRKEEEEEERCGNIPRVT